MSHVYHYLRYAEPARLRGIWTAVIALALALGVAIPADVDGKVTALIAAVSVLLPLLQAETTRAVVSPAVDDPDDGLDYPSEADFPAGDPGDVAPIDDALDDEQPVDDAELGPEAGSDVGPELDEPTGGAHPAGR